MKANAGIFGLWQGLSLKGGVRVHRPDASEREALQSQVNAAHREWQAAQQYFQMVSDPELVDHAIYALEAAQRKYMYLFRQLRDKYELHLNQEG